MAKDLSSMRTLLALLFALVLILATLQADAVEEENERRFRMKAKRQLLTSETAFGRKGNAGGVNDPTHPKDLPDKGSGNSNTANSSNNQQGTENNNDDDDDSNESYQNYGNGSGTSTGSHHYFVDDRRPPVHG